MLNLKIFWHCFSKTIYGKKRRVFTVGVKKPPMKTFCHFSSLLGLAAVAPFLPRSKSGVVWCCNHSKGKREYPSREWKVPKNLGEAWKNCLEKGKKRERQKTMRWGNLHEKLYSEKILKNFYLIIHWKSILNEIVRVRKVWVCVRSVADSLSCE